MEWQQFVMNLETLNPANVEDILLRHGAQSVTFSDAGDAPVLEPGPGETPLWSSTRITGLFGPDADIAGLIEDLRASLGVDDLPEHRRQFDRPRQPTGHLQHPLEGGCIQPVARGFRGSHPCLSSVGRQVSTTPITYPDPSRTARRADAVISIPP